MSRASSLLAAAVLFAALASVPAADDQVTISKSRLEELERKEAELNRLQSRPEITNSAGQQTARDQPHAAARRVKPVASIPVAPAESLPPLQPGVSVDAEAISSHYVTNPKTADARYQKQQVIVIGQVERIEKPMMRRQVEVVLKGVEGGPQVLCTMAMPDRNNSVYTIEGGSQLVGIVGGIQVPLFKVGAPCRLTARCKGLKGSSVLFSGTLGGP